MKITLKAARVNAEMRQKEVAERMGVSVDRIKYLESKVGSALISYKDLCGLCSIYGCTPDDIILPIDSPKSEVVEVS